MNSDDDLSVCRPGLCSCVLAGSILLGLMGCKSPKGLPEDPLFLSRTPVEAQALSGPPLRLAATEPAIPPYPIAAKDTRPPGRDVQPVRDPAAQPANVPVPIVPPQ